MSTGNALAMRLKLRTLMQRHRSTPEAGNYSTV